MKTLLLCLAVLLGAVPALAQGQTVVLEHKPLAIDGDTVVLSDGTNVRLVDYDAPEVFSPNCPEEAALGYRALGRLAVLIRRRTVRLERLSGLDKYRRTLARLWVGSEPIADVLIREGLAVPYDGRSKRVYWAQTLCGLENPLANSGYLPDR